MSSRETIATLLDQATLGVPTPAGPTPIGPTVAECDAKLARYRAGRPSHDSDNYCRRSIPA